MPLECQTIWIHIRHDVFDVLFDLVRVLTVCKGYQQTGNKETQGWLSIHSSSPYTDRGPHKQTHRDKQIKIKWINRHLDKWAGSRFCAQNQLYLHHAHASTILHLHYFAAGFAHDLVYYTTGAIESVLYFRTCSFSVK